MRSIALLLLLSAATAPITATGPLRGEGLEITAPGAAEAVLRAAREAANLEDVDRLNAAAGQGAQKVSPRLFQVLERALNFCLWSEGAIGPLGGAMPGAACQHLQLNRAQSTAALDAGSRLDLKAFAEGWAIDRAVEALQEKGVATALVCSGAVVRGFGAGPEGKGWKVTLPAVPGQEDRGVIWLRDRALAAADLQSGLFNQRTGQPATGALAVFAVTELAADAQALAASSLITGPREGQMRIGSIRPRPSLLWAIGSGEGAPLWVEYLWSAVPKR